MNRALIIKKEWLELIFQGIKVWEMRSSKTAIRGEIGLIESGSGLIVGRANLVDCLDPVESRIEFGQSFSKHQIRVRDYDKIKKWRYPWVLEGSERFDDPIPYEHPQGAVIWVKL